MQIPSYTHGPSKMRTIWYYCALFLALCTITLTCAFLLARPAYAATTDVSSTPMITWDASMIYAGQNNNLPWGPVGELATVHGSGFPKAKPQLTLFLVPGDSNANPLLCISSGVHVTSATVDNAGKFDAGFLWPAAAGSVKQKYSICAKNGNTPFNVKDSGPFTVLAGSPVIHISTSSVAAGGSVIVTGQNWVPPQPVTVVIGRCGNCVGAPGNTFISSTVSSSGPLSGTFSATLIIPTSFGAGTYTVDAYAHMNNATRIALLDANNTMQNALPHLTITGAVPTATPTATATATATASPTDVPTDTATVTATQTVTPVGANTNSTPPSSGSQDNNHFPLVLILGALLPLVATIIGLLVYMLKQRNKGPIAPRHILPSQAGRFSQLGAPDQAAYNFQQQQPMQQTGQFAPQQNWPQNNPNDVPQQDWPQHYPNDVPQQDWP
ncbi:MAG: hypothetical protein ABI234_11470 [Ktedonobacteraceae bacterium]